MEDFLTRISENILVRVSMPIGILICVTGLALLLRRFAYSRLRVWSSKTSTKWDDIIIQSTSLATLLWSFFLGIFAAVHFAVVPDSWDRYISIISPILLVVIGIYTGVILARVLIEWYLSEVASKTASPLDDLIMKALKWILPVVAFFIGLVLVLDMLDIQKVEDYFVEPVMRWLIGPGKWIAILGAVCVVLILLVTMAIPKIISRAVQHSREDQSDEEVRKRAETLSAVLVASLQAVIIAVITFMILDKLGLNITPVIAGVSVVGIAIGFGAQSLVKDIIAGLFILLENQYRKGDVVRIADTMGLVEDINLRRTTLRDTDGIVHTVPNGEIRVASNFTKGYSRVNLNISVAYGEDLDRVIAVINRVGRELAEDPIWSAQILTPPQVLRVDKFGESGIEIKVVGDTKPLQQWATMGQLRLRIKKAFDQEGIQIPWPHMKVYFGDALGIAASQRPGKEG